MRGVYKTGFTIIETMLFLGITGLLIIGILAATGNSIAIQRYHDSATSLESNIQDLYTNTNQVTNDRDASTKCSVSAKPSIATAVGQSDCVIIGQYMTIDNDTIKTSTVLGSDPTTTSDGSIGSDIAVLKKYHLTLLASSTTTTTLDWGAVIAWPKSGGGSKSPTTPRTIAILVLNSPISGRSYTFTADNTTTPLSSMIVSGIAIPGQSDRRVCIDSNSGASGFNGGLAVYIDAYAGSTSDIQLVSNNDKSGSVC